jgi:hypothetical protein
MTAMSGNGSGRSVVTRGRSLAGAVVSLLRDLREVRVRLDDVVANQAVLTEALGAVEIDGYREPCADPALSTRLCRQADLGTEYAAWLQRMGQPLVAFRKEWEHVAICRALEAADLLRPGATGLGFGVGKEPLVAAFAAAGVHVTATDLDASDQRAAVWASTDQHALTLDSLRVPDLCPDDVLEERVTVRPADMNAVPADLTGFDFVWSACAFEHLGSIDAGLAFVERAMGCLAPGGLAVHTTEFNVSSNDATVTQGGTVAFRQRDLDELGRRLAAAGHYMAPLELRPRDGVLDRVLDVPPYHRRSLILRLEQHHITSAVIVAQAAGGERRLLEPTG